MSEVYGALTLGANLALCNAKFNTQCTRPSDLTPRFFVALLPRCRPLDSACRAKVVANLQAELRSFHLGALVDKYRA